MTRTRRYPYPMSVRTLVRTRVFLCLPFLALLSGPRDPSARLAAPAWLRMSRDGQGAAGVPTWEKGWGRVRSRCE